MFYELHEISRRISLTFKTTSTIAGRGARQISFNKVAEGGVYFESPIVEDNYSGLHSHLWLECYLGTFCLLQAFNEVSINSIRR